MANPALRAEIRQLLAANRNAAMDRVAVIVMLNMVAGGHYEERFDEQAIDRELQEMLHGGEIAGDPLQCLRLIA